MQTSAPPAYWDDIYAARDLRYEPEDVPFKDLFDRFMPQGGTCFEVGCYPGSFLIYLGNRFGYTVSGIDTTPQTESALPQHVRDQGVRVGSITQRDFFTLTEEEQYDVVCSFGFLEHFQNFTDVIERHAMMVRPGGTLFLSCPNFRKLQFLLHRWLDPVNLSRHVLSAMDLAVWEAVLRAKGFQIEFSGYYRTAGFWAEDSPRNIFHRNAMYYARRLLHRIDCRFSFPNSWLSPYMVCIAKRPV